MNFDVYTSSKRFNFILSVIPKEWNKNQLAPVEKTMLFDSKTTQIWWENHDGIIDGLEEPHKIIEVSRFLDKNKKQFYVKPNFCNEKSIKIIDFARSNHVTLITTMPWSYYSAMLQIHARRFELRKLKRFNDAVMFAGCQNDRIDTFFKRSQHILAAKSLYKNYEIVSGLHHNDYINKIVETGWAHQPHGVCLRHSIYECLALGTPSIIPHCSYLKKEISDTSLIYHDLSLPKISSETLQNLSQKCIETYESFMTPEKILNSVLSSI